MIDGDTVRVRASVWFGLTVEVDVRLAGIDARDALHVMLGNGRVVLRDVCYGQYAGRVMVRIAAPNGDDAGEHLRA